MQDGQKTRRGRAGRGRSCGGRPGPQPRRISTRAEDAVQEATIAALQTWPETGIPDEPRAWLLTVARRKALDVLRREQRRTDKEAEAVALLEQQSDAGDIPPASAVDDDLLRLVFTCCHPALRLEAQVALTLRTVCGLAVEDVARALLISEDTAAKRLVRTRQKIARARIPYRVPSDADLPARLTAVAAVVHLMFTVGYRGTPGDELLRVDLLHRGDPPRPAARRPHARRTDAARAAGAAAAHARAARRPPRCGR